MHLPCRLFPQPRFPLLRPHAAPRFLVLIDAAHGGNDTGAHLTPTQLEKDVTLDLSNRLRSMLSARGIGVATTRDSDATLPAVNRAEIANRTPFAACILIHATATGSGVHLYTSSLAAAPLVEFMPWQTTQSAYVTQSLKLSSDVDSALAHAEIPVTLGRTSLQPMDSFACPQLRWRLRLCKVPRLPGPTLSQTRPTSARSSTRSPPPLTSGAMTGDSNRDLPRAAHLFAVMLIAVVTMSAILIRLHERAQDRLHTVLESLR